MTSSKKNIGLWTIVFNVTLFVIACGLLFVIKSHPQYKPFLVTFVVGLFIIIFYTGLQYYWDEKRREAQKLAETANIVPRHCPDYWNKVTTANGTTCQNHFVKRDADNDDGIVTYSFGGSNAPAQYSLEDMANMTNQQKCWNFTSAGIPWVDLSNKCLDTGV